MDDAISKACAEIDAEIEITQQMIKYAEESVIRMIDTEPVSWIYLHTITELRSIIKGLMHAKVVIMHNCSKGERDGR